jgi:hypothetical protein
MHRPSRAFFLSDGNAARARMREALLRRAGEGP